VSGIKNNFEKCYQSMLYCRDLAGYITANINPDKKPPFPFEE
jgi:hypothetical protein